MQLLALRQRVSQLTRRERGQLLLMGFLLIVVVVLATFYLPAGIDWTDTYRPAARLLLAGQSPYQMRIYYAAPWALLPLLPLALLPEAVGRAVLFIVGLGTFAYTAHRLGAGRLALAAFLVSPPVVHCLLNSNIEWLALVGVVLPPQWGLLFVSTKPQIGAGVALFWLWAAWRRGGAREVARIFWPVTAALLLSLALFGLWPLRFSDTLELTHTYNASLWPSTIPVGLALLVAAARRQQVRFALAAGPCLSPYVLLHAWVGALAAVLPLPVETVAAVIGLWLLVILRATGVG